MQQGEEGSAEQAERCYLLRLTHLSPRGTQGRLVCVEVVRAATLAYRVHVRVLQGEQGGKGTLSAALRK